MAMLAEPRRRKRYNLVPKGKALFEDSERFGTKMLEKMGWEKGKGLGSRGDGQQDFIRIRYKNDPNGLGYEERDDQWTQHEKQFNGLLENLNGGSDSNGNSAPDDCEVATPALGLGFVAKAGGKEKLKEKFSGQSLEEKSKSSKARVHYKKFTKGKDMSQYSEKDLANIFGKKATPEDTNIYDQFQAFNAGGNVEEETKVEEVKTFESGTQIINTGVSVGDYFKMKMEALKAKRNGQVVAEVETKEEVDGAEIEAPVKSKKSKKRSVAEEIDESAPPSSEPLDEIPRKKKKKSKKQEIPCEQNEVDVDLNGTAPEEKGKEKGSGDAEEIFIPDTAEEGAHQPQPAENNPRKKEKKNKKVLTEEVEAEGLDSVDITLTKRKSKKPLTNSDLSESTSKEVLPEKNENIISAVVEISNCPLKKKKKSKNISVEELPSQVVCEETPADSIPSKKKKNKTQTVEETTQVNTIVPKTHDTTEEPSKKKKRSTLQEEDEQHEIPAPTPDKSSTKSKKKNKSLQCPSVPTPSNEVSSQLDLTPVNDNCLIDTYKISSFCAEKFRNIEFVQFNGSNIANICGYGLCGENLQLVIKKNARDAKRIMSLWNGTIDKYTHETATGKIYDHFMKKARLARSTKKRIPKFNTKSLKRRQVFGGL